MPLARPGAHLTNDFNDLLAWFATIMAKTASSRLCQCRGALLGGRVNIKAAQTIRPITRRAHGFHTNTNPIKLPHKATGCGEPKSTLWSRRRTNGIFWRLIGFSSGTHVSGYTRPQTQNKFRPIEDACHFVAVRDAPYPLSSTFRSGTDCPPN